MFYRTYASLADIPEPFRKNQAPQQPENPFEATVLKNGAGTNPNQAQPNSAPIPPEATRKNSSQDMLFMVLILMLLMD